MGHSDSMGWDLGWGADKATLYPLHPLHPLSFQALSQHTTAALLPGPQPWGAPMLGSCSTHQHRAHQLQGHRLQGHL